MKADSQAFLSVPLGRSTLAFLCNREGHIVAGDLDGLMPTGRMESVEVAQVFAQASVAPIQQRLVEVLDCASTCRDGTPTMALPVKLASRPGRWVAEVVPFRGYSAGALALVVLNPVFRSSAVADLLPETPIAGSFLQVEAAVGFIEFNPLVDVVSLDASAASILEVPASACGSEVLRSSWILSSGDAPELLLRDVSLVGFLSSLVASSQSDVLLRREHAIEHGVRVQVRHSTSLRGELVYLVSLWDLSGLASARRDVARSIEALEQTAQRSNAILSALSEAVMAVDRSGVVVYANSAACSIFRASVDQLVGARIDSLMPGEQRARYAGRFRRFNALEESRVVGHPLEVAAVRFDGSLVNVGLSIATAQQVGASRLYVGVLKELAGPDACSPEEQRFALFDTLTGLPNRRLFLESIARASYLGGSDGAHSAVLVVDVDGFKKINKRLGSIGADIVLRNIGSCLASLLLQVDAIARIEGDKFALLLMGAGSDSDAAAKSSEALAQEVIESVRASFVEGYEDVEVGVSVGISLFKGAAVDSQRVILEAEIALKNAKALGREKYQFYDPHVQAEAEAKAEFARQMEVALGQGEYHLLYQPQVSLEVGVVGVEALVRWSSPTYGSVSPSYFIPLAEETGFIDILGRWILDRACEQLYQWSLDPTTRHWTIAVNVSACQSYKETFVDDILSVVRRWGIDPSRLKLELTESMLTRDMAATTRQLTELRRQGIKVSLDDFGTGYSSLAYLKNLPLSQLKIDQSFVRDLERDASSIAIARTVVALGKGLNLTVIAEGVETEGQAELLQEIGCDFLQGYYFGRPMTATDVEELAVSPAYDLAGLACNKH